MHSAQNLNSCYPNDSPERQEKIRITERIDRSNDKLFESVHRLRSQLFDVPELPVEQMFSLHRTKKVATPDGKGVSRCLVAHPDHYVFVVEYHMSGMYPMHKHSNCNQTIYLIEGLVRVSFLDGRVLTLRGEEDYAGIEKGQDHQTSWTSGTTVAIVFSPL